MWTTRAARTLTCASVVLVPMSAHAGEATFTDITVSAGVDVTHDSSGYSHWNYTGAGAVADFNRDGWQDIFVISGGDGGVLDRLFINDGDGTFTDEAVAWGLTIVHRGKGVAVGDFNNDGWPDLYVTSAGPLGPALPGHHKLYRNNGNGTFTNIAADAGVNYTTTIDEDGFGAVFGDYDLDGDLDLFVAGFRPGGKRLFRNNGDETFTDVTDIIDLFGGTPFNLNSFSPRLVDMDGDAYPELLLVSDFGTSRYFRNNTDGTFTDVTSSSGTGLDENGMGQTVGDFNRDGLLDWYVTSIYFPPWIWTGNKLYTNTGNHTYVENADALGIDDGGYGWGALAIDFNHDGRLDIAETNGGELSQFEGEQSYLWIQDPTGDFDEMAVASGFEHYSQGRGMASIDVDNDGDQDIVLFSNNDCLHLFANDLKGPDINWVRIFLETSGVRGLAPDGYGAKVMVTAGGQSQFIAISPGSTFMSQSEASAHFGLGSATFISEIRVDWPDGSQTVQRNVEANQTITISAGPSVPGDVDGDGAVTFSDLLSVLTAWGPCPDPPAACPADLDGSGTIDFGDILIVLTNWAP